MSLFSVVLIVEDSELLTPFIIVVDFWSPLDSCLLLFFWLLTSFLLSVTLASDSDTDSDESRLVPKVTFVVVLSFSSVPLWVWSDSDFWRLYLDIGSKESYNW